MLRLFKSAAVRSISYSLIVLLVLGLLIGAIRLALPFADLFRSELESTLSETLGMEVRVGHLGLRLAGLAPQIELRDAVLLDPDSGRPQLSLEQLRVKLSLVASLRKLTPHIESLTLVGADLAIRRLDDGSITISGLEAIEAGDPEAMTFFLGNGRFQLADSNLYWSDEKTGTPTLHLSEVQVDFENRGERHRVALLARTFDDQQTHLRLVGDLRGQPGSPAEWSGEIYLHLQDGNLNRILEGRLPASLQLETESVELESWNHLQGGLITRSLNRITAGGLNLWSDSGAEHTAPLQLDRLDGLLRWQRVGNGWQIQGKDLALTRGGTERPISDMAIKIVASDDGEWKIEGGTQLLNLADIRDLLLRVPRLPPESLDLLGEFRPAGQLHDLRFRILHRPELPLRWAASARIADLSFDAHGQFPGIRGLTMKLAMNEREGELILSGGGPLLDLPRLFPDPLRLEETAGEIRWKRDGDGALQIGAREITVGNADIATRSRFALLLPADGGGPLLDLYTQFGDVEIASIRHYVPSNRLKEKLASWLEHALVDGRIPSGTLFFHGAVQDFPFDQQQGRFEVLFEVENCILEFNEDWPRLEEVAGKVHFENQEMEALVSSGRFLDSKLASTRIRIPDLRKAVAIEIQGTAQGPFADTLRVLGETPVRKELGAVADTLKAKGVSRLDLDMAIPLPHKGHKDALRLAGELSWPGPATLWVADKDIELTDLSGTLHFTERTLEAQSIEARLWDVPVRLRVDTLEPQGEADAITSIRTTGRFPISILAQQFPARSWESLKGQADLALHLQIGSADMGESVPPMDFALTSDLTGLALALPVPLGKSAKETRALRLSGRLTPEKPLLVQGAYGDLGIGLELDRGNDGKLRFARGIFNLGGAAPQLPEGDGLHLRGSIATLDLEPWLKWWTNREQLAGAESGGNKDLRSVNLRIGHLLLTKATLNDVRFDLENRSDRWEARISARELEGAATIPHRPRSGPMRITLERLNLQGLLAHEGRESETRTDESDTDPRRAHALDLSIDRLLWGNNRLGSVTLRSKSVLNGLEFTELSLAGPFMSIEGRGSWLQTEAGPHTSVSLTAKGSDLGEFLRSLEFKSLFYKAPAEVVMDLNWPGAPDQLSAARLEGQIRFDVGAGSLLEVEPGVGRMLGILNVEALQRRLTLDFSDLFGRGYAFEKIHGQLDIKNGNAIIKELVIEGPSANISIAGSTNLVDQQFNQIVTVTPRIGTGVALASAVAGGPLVGAAVFLADRVAGGAVDKLGRHQYVVKGPWAEPEIRRGILGADAEKEPSQGHFLEGSGRAGAAGPREPKPTRARAGTRATTAAGGSRHSSPSSRGGGENLFMNGL